MSLNRILYKPSILKSIFFRNGKETENTILESSIIENRFPIVKEILSKEEFILVSKYEEDELLITDQSTYLVKDNKLNIIKHENLKNVLPFIPYIMNEIPDNYYNVFLQTINNEEFDLKVVRDESFNGILQIFNFIIRLKK